MNMKKGLTSLPLYRLYLEDFRVFSDMPVEEFVIGDAQDAFAAFMMQEDTRRQRAKMKDSASRRRLRRR